MTKSLYARIADLEALEQCAKLASTQDSDVVDLTRGVEVMRAELRQYGIEQGPDESFAETLCRAFGITAEELKALFRQRVSKLEDDQNS